MTKCVWIFYSMAWYEFTLKNEHQTEVIPSWMGRSSVLIRLSYLSICALKCSRKSLTRIVQFSSNHFLITLFITFITVSSIDKHVIAILECRETEVHLVGSIWGMSIYTIGNFVTQWDANKLSCTLSAMTLTKTSCGFLTKNQVFVVFTANQIQF